jgi:hypothetical protein
MAMSTQSNKKSYGTKLFVFLGILFFLVGGGMLAGQFFSVVLTGPFFMFLFALGFFGLVFWSKKNWWAIIPGGIFASIGLVSALNILVPYEGYPRLPGMLTWGFYTWVLFLGLATTFGILWLRCKTLPTSWARYPAVGFLAVAALFIIEGAHFS